ncbi:MAG: holo-ACP synthase [Candidatus Sumerlaeota bacterium]|nr:holo-ACP synthase [Candidatus Sumerlaeota bacterium]
MIIGIGVDLVEHERVQNVLAKFEGRFARKIFTEEERAYSDARATPHIHYAARFAAKEAFLKAVGLGMAGGMRWRDCGVINDAAGKPELSIVGAALERCRRLGATHAHVSLSHSREHAIAIVILERREDSDEAQGLGRKLSL